MLYRYLSINSQNKHVVGNIEAENLYEAILILKQEYDVKFIIKIKRQKESLFQKLKKMFPTYVRGFESLGSGVAKKVSFNLPELPEEDAEEKQSFYRFYMQNDSVYETIKDIDRNTVPLEDRTIKKIKKKDVLFFTKRLAILIDSGMPLIRVLSNMATQVDNPYFARVIAQVRQDIMDGESMAMAMAKYPSLFDKFYVSMIVAGETSGSLSQSLKNIAKHLEDNLKLSRTLSSTSIYPIVVFSILFLLGLLGYFWFIPYFEQLFAELDVDVPLITTIVFGAVNNFIYVAAGIVILIAGSKLIYRNLPSRQRSKYQIMRSMFVLKIPVINNLIQSLSMYNFIYGIALMQKSGINLVNAIKLASKSINSEVIKIESELMISDVVEGKSLSEAIKNTRYFDATVQSLINVGEETGKMEDSLDVLLEFYKSQVDDNLENIVQLMQPVSILVIAAAVVPVILAIYLPIMSISSGVM